MEIETGIFLLFPLNLQGLLLRFLLALVVGAIIGFERESRAKAAGLRTHMLVSLGSALFVLVPIQLGMAQTQQSLDAFSRVLQGIISGIGFVGGGVILHGARKVEMTQAKGLTTAVSIWLSCGLGIAAGCGLWTIGVLGALFALLTLGVLKKLE